MTDWTTLQAEVSTWALHNFGKQGAWQPMLGLIEEVGEFTAAREAMINLHTPTSQVRPQMEDAIADQCIYALNLCEIVGLPFQRLADDNLPDDLTDAQILGALAAACHAVLKNAQGIRGVDGTKLNEKLFIALSLWFRWASAQCSKWRLEPILACTTAVWDEVRMRDWRKNPTDANRVAASQKQGVVDNQCGEHRPVPNEAAIEFCQNRAGHGGPHRWPASQKQVVMGDDLGGGK